MNNNKLYYKNLEFVENEPIDYYIIISFATDDEHYIPEKTIILQMEPWVYDRSKNWGIHAWPKKWSDPDKSLYFHVRQHKDFLNTAQWTFPIPKEIKTTKLNKFIAIISDKYIDEGHINRVNFIKYIESKGHNFIDVYGHSNSHKFKNYMGFLESKIIIEDYMYVFSVENNREFNYATEKIFEAFIAGSLCFYDGCPNLSDYFNEMSYVPIDCADKDHTLQIMLNALESNLWQERLQYIEDAKKLTYSKYGFLPIINNLLQQI